MSELRIRMKIADCEFEAEGLNEVVRAELASFKRLLPATSTSSSIGLDILHVKGRVVSLKAKSDSVDDAVLALLLGQKHFRANERVTGAEIMDGLRASGQRVSRVDYLLSRHASNGTVTAI